MDFLDRMEETLNEEFNESITENGAVGYATTGKELLDFNYKIASYRNKGESQIIKDFEKVWIEDKVLAMQFLFFIRDREEGLGERRLFRIIIKHLAKTEPEIIKKVIPVIAEYGRWDDLLEFEDTPLENYAINEIIGGQLLEDTRNYLNNKPISLLAKWLPSVNAGKHSKERAKRLIAKMPHTNEETYRKSLSKLRKRIDVVERKMCANEWDEIKYDNVPSRANLNYNNAFLKHDEERRRKYLEDVNTGKKKINAGKLYPHDIVHKYTKGYSWINTSLDSTLEELWKSLPKKEIENTLVVADGSGSMSSRVGNTGVTALDVANALAIYFAEHNKGEFKNKYITFSMRPKFVSFDGLNTLHEKINKALTYDECANTNIEAVFDLILTTAIKNNMKQEDMPKNILIISDMEFDECASTSIGDSRQYYRWGINKPSKKLF